MTLTTLPNAAHERGRTTRWLADVPRRSVVAGAAVAIGVLSMLLAALAGDGWTARLELALAVASVAALLLAPARQGTRLALGSVGLLVLLELVAGRYEGGLDWGDVGRPLVLAGLQLAASLLRYGIRRRDTELQVAAEAIDQLTRRDRIVDLLAGGIEPTWLEAELARSQRHHHRLSLVLARPDGFVQLASASPTGGQEVLEAVAEVVGSELRAIDVALRHDEATFALILPETPVEGARVAAERIRLLLPLRVGQIADKPVTISLGVAEFPADATTHDELVAGAERALERAVDLGGNRTVCVSAPSTAPPGWTVTGARPR